MGVYKKQRSNLTYNSINKRVLLWILIKKLLNSPGLNKI